MSGGQLLLGLLIVGLTALTAALAAAETVLTRLGLVRALAVNEEERSGAAALLWLLEHPARGLNTLLLLTVVARLSAAGIVTALALGAGSAVAAGALLVLALGVFIVAEVAPRTYTLRHLERTGLALAPTVAGLARLLGPIVQLLVRAGGTLAGGWAHGPFASDEQLRELIGTTAADEEVEIEEEERAMIHSIFELGDTVCREIMSPRPDMVTVSVTDPLHAVVDVAVASGYSRIPVHGERTGEIVGVVYAKDLLQRLHERGGRAERGPWTDLLREPTFVPESRRADELLRDLQRQEVHLAVVVDEYGDVAGLVTIEDIIEEIVGEIVDEYDHEQPPIVRLDDDRLRVSSRVTVHDLNELLDADLPEDEGWDTVGGLLIGMLGRVPEPGDDVRVDGVTLEAESVQGRRVGEVLVTVHPRGGQDDAEQDRAGHPGVREREHAG